jgi:flagellar motor switch protein FliN/FliY
MAAGRGSRRRFYRRIGVMATFDDISIDISVVLGTTTMPVHQLLRMGRGAVIDLDVAEEDDVSIYANKTLVAKGQVVLLGERIGVSITEVLLRAPDVRPMRTDGPL